MVKLISYIRNTRNRVSNEAVTQQKQITHTPNVIEPPVYRNPTPLTLKKRIQTLFTQIGQRVVSS